MKQSFPYLGSPLKEAFLALALMYYRSLRNKKSFSGIYEGNDVAVLRLAGP